MKSYRFLIDVNLPKHFGFFNSDDFEFVIDINGKWPDKDIWEYARQSQLVIVTKDSDFYHRSLLSADDVKVIYIKLGNLLLRDLHIYFITNWDTIVSHLGNSKMIIATKTSIETIVL
jgi:predicted nuclease of predicted toxin-antitoxin system